MNKAACLTAFRFFIAGWILTFLSVPLKVHGQSGQQWKEQELTFGLERSGLTDQGLSIQQASFHLAGLSYRYRVGNTKHYQLVTIEGRKGYSPALSGSQLAQFRLVYAHAFSLSKASNPQMRNYLGYQLETTPAYLSYAGKNSWASSIAAGLSGSSEFNFHQRQVRFSFFLPLVAAISRPDPDATVTGRVNGLLYDSYSHLYPASWGTFQGAVVNIRYVSKREKKLRWILDAGWRYQRFRTDNRYQQNGFSIGTGISW